VIALPGPH